MWSAFAIALSLAGGIAAYAAFGIAALARGVPAWQVVIGAPVVYLAILALFVAWYFALAWMLPRAAAARGAHRPCGNRAARLARILDARRRAVSHAVLPRARPRTAGGTRGAAGAAAARRPVQRGRVGAHAARPARARHRTGLRAVLRTAAGVDRALRRPGARAHRGDPRGDRRGTGHGRVAQHGRARRARVPAPIRRPRALRRLRRDRRAVPRQRARAAACSARRSRSCDPATRGWPRSRRRRRRAGRRSSRCGRGTTRWSRRRPLACSTARRTSRCRAWATTRCCATRDVLEIVRREYGTRTGRTCYQ